MIDLDYGYLAKNDAALKEWWDKTLQGLRASIRGEDDAAAALSFRPGAGGWTAAAMVAPASIVVTIGIVLPILILFRYSLNQYTSAKVMVDAFTIENYLKFFTDPFYLAVLLRTIRVAALCTAILRGPGLSYGLLSCTHAIALQEFAVNGRDSAALRWQRRARGGLDGSVRKSWVR